MNCTNCSKQYFCDLITNYSNNNQICERFKSWIYTKNYGEVYRVENTKTNKNK